MSQQPVIIIGSGLAGYTLAREFRKLDPDTPLKIFTRDDGCSYSKPMLSNAFAKGKSAADLAMFDADHMAKQLNAEIFPHTTISQIRPQQNTIIVRAENDEQTHTYSRLVLALGADQVKLAFKGDAADDVLTVNDLKDYAEFRELTRDKKSVAIIGGGLIGCEFANDLAHGGHTVHIIELNDFPLKSLLPKLAARSLHQALEGLGIHWHLEQSVTQIIRQNNHYKLELKNNKKTETLDNIDLVLSAIGLKPRTELANQAGIQTNRGIVVDRTLRTSIENIFALGDCAEVDGLVLPFVMPLMNSARALAKTLNNETTPVNYPAMPVIIKTPVCPVVVMPPPAGLEGQWTSSTSEDGTRSLFYDNNKRLMGFALTGSATSERNALLKDIPGMLH